MESDRGDAVGQADGGCGEHPPVQPDLPDPPLVSASLQERREQRVERRQQDRDRQLPDPKTSLMTPAFSPARLVSSTVVAMHSSRTPNSEQVPGATCVACCGSHGDRGDVDRASPATMKATSQRGRSQSGQALTASEPTLHTFAPSVRTHASSGCTAPEVMAGDRNAAPYCHRASAPAVKAPLRSETTLRGQTEALVTQRHLLTRGWRAQFTDVATCPGPRTSADVGP